MSINSLRSFFRSWSWPLIFWALLISLIFPDQALAGGIEEFSGPIEKVMQTITGPVGKIVAISGVAFCGYQFIMNKEDLTGGFKAFLGVVLGICFIALAMPVVNKLFSFSGAVI